ncbi:MAG TPA: hypothetical protein VKX28_16235 [Xanthobacteraceae bacterium]|nr:hypothetical protein [Xanthobacteraceae bacterium]
MFVLLTLLALPLGLGGCFDSDYDIAHQLKPVRPISNGAYSGEGLKKDVTISGDTYEARSPEDGDVTFLRFYRVPESDTYLIVQTWRRDDSHRFKYGYARVLPDKIDIFIADHADLTYLDRLLKKAPRNSATIADEIIDGPRDTLYVLREVLRHRPEMKKILTYMRVS